jgi:hypothetical protein
MQLIKLENLREMIEAGAVTSASIVGQKGGYAVMADVGTQQRTLGTRRGEVRIFTVADTAIKMLRDMGLMKFSIDTTNYQEGTLRAPRQDTVKRHDKARAALEYDHWFREQVQGTKEKIERGEGRLYSSDEVFDRLKAHATKRAAQSSGRDKA